MKNLRLRDVLLLRVLLPMAVVMIVSGVVSFLQARAFVNASYDRSLLEEARALAQQVAIVGDDVWLDMSAEEDALMRADSSDQIYYQVQTASGRISAGDMVLQARKSVSSYPHYFDTRVQGKRVRGVLLQAGQTAQGEPILVQFAETRSKRESLASDMVMAVIAPQLALMALAWLAIRRGVQLGLKPLNEVTHTIESRHPDELEPLPLQGLPQELHPMLGAFNTLLGRLSEAAESQRRFIADAAHQLRTPLAALRIQLERALRESDTERREILLQQLLNGIERTARLSTQLLMLARTEPGTRQPALEAVDLCEIAFRVGGVWVPRSIEKGVDLGLVAHDQPLLVQAEPVMLGELINNLIDNALSYGGKRITLRVAPQGESAEIAVIDDGPGVPAESRGRIFERFFRPAGSQGNGSGLGLAIVREIARSFGGEAGYRRKAEEGTCFYVRLPLLSGSD